MKLIYIASAAALMAMTASTVTNAQSLKIREIMASQDKQLAEAVDHTNKTCETNIVVNFDWKDAPGEQLTQYSASSFCDAAMSGLRHTCESAAGKDAVKQKIKTMTCGFGPARSVALKDGALDYKINFSSSNDMDYVFDFLQNNL